MKKYFLAAALVCAFISGACSGGKEKGVGAVEHVVLIGLDGWGAPGLEGPAETDMPVLRKFISEGAYSDGITDAGGWPAVFGGAGEGLFALLRSQMPSPTLGAFYEPDGTGALFAGQGLDRDVHLPAENGYSDRVAFAAADYIRREKPVLTAVIFGEPGATVQEHGHDSPAYQTKLEGLDFYIGTLRDAAVDAGIYDKTLFIVTGGGRVDSEGAAGDMRFPLVFFGAGVKGGRKIGGSPGQEDIAPTVAYVFGLDRPEVWAGTPLTGVFGR